MREDLIGSCDRTVIALDTSVLHSGDKLVDDGTLLRFGAWCDLTYATILIPVVVQREVDDWIRVRIDAAFKKVEAARQMLRGIGSAVPGWKESDPAVLSRSAVRAFRERLQELSPRPAPIPSVRHDQIIDRIQARRKPFASTGDGRDRGYKDYLIWQSIVEQLHATEQDGISRELILVTANKNDFGSDDPHVLHQDLADDLKDLNLTSVVFSSIGELLRECPPPGFEEHAKLISIVSSDDSWQMIERFVNENASGWLNDYAPDYINGDFIEVYNAAIEYVGYVTVTEIARPLLSNGGFTLVEVECEFPVTVSGDGVVDNDSPDDPDWQGSDLWENATAYGVIELKLRVADGIVTPVGGYVVNTQVNL